MRRGMRRDIKQMGKNYRSISLMEKFFFISCVYLHEKRKKVNSIPSESWLDHVGEKDRTDMYVCWCTWF